jgi:hypothetical protein
MNPLHATSTSSLVRSLKSIAMLVLLGACQESSEREQEDTDDAGVIAACQASSARCLGDTAVLCEAGKIKHIDCLAEDSICVPKVGCSKGDAPTPGQSPGVPSDVRIDAAGWTLPDAASAPLDAGRDAAIDAAMPVDASQTAIDATKPAIDAAKPDATVTLGPGTCQTLQLASTHGSSPNVQLVTRLNHPELDDVLGIALTASPLPSVGTHALQPDGGVAVTIYEIGFYEGDPDGYVPETGHATLTKVISETEFQGSIRDVRLRRCKGVFRPYQPGEEGVAGRPGVRIGCQPAAGAPCVYVSSYSWGGPQ